MGKKLAIGVVGVAAAALAAAAVLRLTKRPAWEEAWRGAIGGVDALLERAGVLVPAAVSEEHFLMPTPSMRAVLKPYRTRIQT